MKKKTKLFKHFITILNILACSVPLIAFAIVTLQDVLPKYFTSLGMQHHGDGSSTFDDDLNALTDSNQFKDMNYHMLNTLDRLDYFNYDISGKRIIEYQTNTLNSVDDFVVGNVYKFVFFNEDLDYSITDFTTEFYFQDIYYILFYGYEGYDYEDSNFAYPYIIYLNSYRYIGLNSINDGAGFELQFSQNFGDNYLDIFSDFYYGDDDFVIFRYTYGDSISAELMYFFEECPQEYLQYCYSVENVEGYDDFDDFIDYQNNRSYTDIIHDTDTHLPLNIDFISLFTQSDIINRNGNVAIYLFINYYMNYLINILIILFLPELTIIFFFMLKNLTYKLIDKEI